MWSNSTRSLALWSCSHLPRFFRGCVTMRWTQSFTRATIRTLWIKPLFLQRCSAKWLGRGSLQLPKSSKVFAWTRTMISQIKVNQNHGVSSSGFAFKGFLFSRGIANGWLWYDMCSYNTYYYIFIYRCKQSIYYIYTIYYIYILNILYLYNIYYKYYIYLYNIYIYQINIYIYMYIIYTNILWTTCIYLYISYIYTIFDSKNIYVKLLYIYTWNLHIYLKYILETYWYSWNLYILKT